MNVRIVAIGLYIGFIYWLSSKGPFLHTIFYPTLGAFCFLFVSRSFDLREIARITVGATIASVIGTLLQHLNPGAASLIANTLIVAWLIRKLHWNAPPILAVSIIPFFVDHPNIWIMPLSVCVSLLGLTAVLAAVHFAEPRLAAQWTTRAGQDPVA